MNRKYYSKLFWYVMVAMLWLVLGTMPALAHRVTIFAWVDGDMVHTQSKIGGGKPIKDSTVKVYGPGGRALLEGKTDQNGMFSFKVPQKTALRVVLDAAMGHSAEWTIPAEEIMGSAVENRAVATSESVSATLAPDTVRVESRPMMLEPAKTDLTEEKIEAIVNRALDQRLQPVVQMLAKTYDRGPGLTEIIGGFGYIIGLVGIALYVAARRKETND